MHYVADAALLQNDLNNLYQWCLNNKLLLNINKCSILSYSRKSQTLIYFYHINNFPLHRSDSITDLGVTFDVKLDFSLHTNMIISKAYKKLGFLKRKTKDFSNLRGLKVLYFRLVYC